MRLHTECNELKGQIKEIKAEIKLIGVKSKNVKLKNLTDQLLSVSAKLLVKNKEQETLKSQLEELMKVITAAKNRVKNLNNDLLAEIEKLQSALSFIEKERLIFDVLLLDGTLQLDRYVSAHRRILVDRVLLWWDKYQTTINQIEKSRSESAGKLNKFLQELRYV